MNDQPSPPRPSPEQFARLRQMAKQARGAIDGRTRAESKAWILPDGAIQPLRTWHAEWLVRNAQMAWQRFGVATRGLHPVEQEQALRLRALRRGFIRLRYLLKGGRLTVELNHRYRRSPALDAVVVFVARNAHVIDQLTVRALGERGRIIASHSVALTKVAPREKPLHIPLLSPARKRRALAGLTGRG